jgi:hypothetical protein
MGILWQSTTIISTDLHIERYWTLFSLPRLELNRIAFVEVFDLTTRGEAAAVKKHVFASIVGSDEAITLLPYDLLDRSSHFSAPPFTPGFLFDRVTLLLESP